MAAALLFSGREVTIACPTEDFARAVFQGFEEIMANMTYQQWIDFGKSVIAEGGDVEAFVQSAPADFRDDLSEDLRSLGEYRSWFTPESEPVPGWKSVHKEDPG
jgi:hypothetical protein